MIHTPPGSQPEPGPAYLESTGFIDCATDSVHRFAIESVGDAASDVDRAVRLYYSVRDGWRYDPFSMSLSPEIYVASNVLRANSGYCITKAILLVAGARALGIQAALGFSDVVNHLTTDKLRRQMGGSTYFMYHGYAVLHLDGRWVKAAPAFNIELCRRFGVVPTEFDGRSDALFQEFDAHDRRHMEYVKEHGVWSDLPLQRIVDDFRGFYPPELFVVGRENERFEDGVPLH